VPGAKEKEEEGVGNHTSKTDDEEENALRY